MFAHIYVNRLKCSLRDKQMMFWTLLFPILLAVFFNMAFSNINSSEAFRSTPVAVVDNEAYRADSWLQTALNAASASEEGDALFDLQTMSEAEAAKALGDGSIIGYFLPGDSLEVVVASNGMRQTILKIFADEYLRTAATFQSIVTLNPSALATLGERIGQRSDLMTSGPTGNSEPNDLLIYYYALIGMACLYGGFWGMREVIAVQANLSGQAARINLVPVHKMKVFAASLCAAFTVQYSSVLLLVAFMSFVQRISFGSQIGFILLTCLTGSLLGIMMGALIGAIGKAGEGPKNGILISVSMLFSFLAGMMQTSVKYLVDSQVPVLQYVNPANLICDSFYALYYYSSLDRYLLNTVIQVVMIFLMFMAVYFLTRRQRYASI